MGLQNQQTTRQTPHSDLELAHEIIQVADALICCVSPEGRITLFNPQCERVTGWKAEEVLGRQLWELLIPKRSIERFRRIFADLREGRAGRMRSTHPWLTKNGDERLISWHNSYLHSPDGEIERIVSVGIDVTDQVRIEQKLRESEENYRTVTENALTGIFIYRNDRFVYCNARLEELLGLHRDHIIGEQVWSFTHPDDREMIEERAKRRQRGDTGLPSHYEFRVVNSSGETIWLEMTVTTMEYQGEKAYLGHVVDISERKEAESERDTLRKRLARSQKMEALTTLVGGIAHDFNNLLTGIMAGTSDVFSQTEPDDPRFRSLGEILQTSRRAKDLISQLLTAGRKGGGAKVELDIHDVVREAVRFISSTMPKSIEIQMDLHAQPLPVFGDRSQLWQAFSNLCLNARDAMKDGGTLTISTHSEEHGGIKSIVVSVADTGPGVPQELKDRIFEPFFTTKERGVGIGLGLAVVYGAIKNHGGTIDVLDNAGGGTIFRIELPRAPSEPAESTDEIAAQEQQPGGSHILIVDDETDLRQIVGRILSREGHIVQSARDAKGALEKIRQYGDKIDLVILDLELPGKSGTEIYGDIVAENPDIKILLSSGQTLGPAAEELLNDGAVGFLQKPYDLWELRRAVLKAIAPPESE